jgi:hypothetical protein
MWNQNKVHQDEDVLIGAGSSKSGTCNCLSGGGSRAHGLIQLVGGLAAVMFVAMRAVGQPFFFSTGDPDGKIATASRPDSPGKIEIESADDFILPSAVTLNSATFTGLLTGNASLSDITKVVVEIYRVFPKDSMDPPSGNVPTRNNSPSDVAFFSRDSVKATLTFTPTVVNSSFTAANSVLNGIFKKPNQTTGGEGHVTGEEVKFNVTFTDQIGLPADHYFFIPQVELAGADQEFYWLSAPKPIVAPGTPITPDLQSWIRNADLDPDWLRIGTDIVGGSPAPTYNASFSLNGTVPEATSTVELLGLAVATLGWCARKLRKAN